MLTDAEQNRLAQFVESSWVVAAFAAHHRNACPPHLRSAVKEVLRYAGLPSSPLGEDGLTGGLAGQLRLAAALATDGITGWSVQDDRTLEEQAQASSFVADWLIAQVVPRLHGMNERLRAADAAMLDIGVGCGVLAVRFALGYPRLRVKGLDILDRSLAQARNAARVAGCADRIELVLQNAVELDDSGRFDLVWLPVPFISQPDVEAALPRILAALRPGGYLIAAAVPGDGPSLSAALQQLRIELLGGAALTAADLINMLRRAGFGDVGEAPSPPVTTPFVTACRPEPGHLTEASGIPTHTIGNEGR